VTALVRRQQIRIDPLVEVFTARAEARALLWQAGEFDLHEAVDKLQHDAERDGLVAAIGQDEVQRIMADAFAAVRLADDMVPKPIPVSEPADDQVAASSTVEAVVYALRTNGSAALQDECNQARLRQLSDRQIKDVLVRLSSQQTKYPSITDSLLELLTELLP
jgi:hypothetical protein